MKLTVKQLRHLIKEVAGAFPYSHRRGSEILASAAGAYGAVKGRDRAEFLRSTLTKLGAPEEESE